MKYIFILAYFVIEIPLRVILLQIATTIYTFDTISKLPS